MTTVTWSDKDKNGTVILSNNRMTATVSSNSKIRASEGKTSGKWYWEIDVEQVYLMVGIHNDTPVSSGANTGNQKLRSYYSVGNKFPENVSYGASFGDGALISVLMDLDNGTLEFWKDGVSQGISHTNLADFTKWYPSLSVGGAGTGIATANFGATPFKYSVPAGFKPYQRASKLLMVIPNNQAYTHNGTTWENIGTPPTDIEERKAFYETHGMERITADQAKQLKTALPNGKGKISVMKL